MDILGYITMKHVRLF